MEWPWKTTADESLPGREAWRLAALFPEVAVAEVHAALALVPLATGRGPDSGQLSGPAGCLSQEVRLITWQGMQLAIPYRLYVQEPAPQGWQRLSNRQRQVLHCLYLRHYDGYLRQRHLEALLTLGNGAPEAFTIPFIFSLVGEYVQEILAVLAASLTPALLAGYVALIAENPLYWQQTQGRVASYWDVYYRRGRRGVPAFRHYVGARLLAQIRRALPPTTT